MKKILWICSVLLAMVSCQEDYELNADFAVPTELSSPASIQLDAVSYTHLTGLHPNEFIETRRHRFSSPVLHYTNDSVNVLNLLEGEEAVVESPTHAFEPFVVHYAETFIIPAGVKEYTIAPYGKSAGKECVTIKAYVRFRCV